jgi:hypothetical protein
MGIRDIGTKSDCAHVCFFVLGFVHWLVTTTQRGTDVAKYKYSPVCVNISPCPVARGYEKGMVTAAACVTKVDDDVLVARRVIY